MTGFASLALSDAPVVSAPDGSEVRVLLARPGGSMAHFRLAPGQITRAVRHRTVEEIWFVLSGHGALWRREAGRAETVALSPGICATIPVGTEFQFRAFDEDLEIAAITLPPWPGGDEAEFVAGVWTPTP